MKTNTFIKLGETEKGRSTYNISLGKETEKAIQLHVKEIVNHRRGPKEYTCDDRNLLNMLETE